MTISDTKISTSNTLLNMLRPRSTVSCVINNYASATSGFFLTSTQVCAKQNLQIMILEVQNRVLSSNGAQNYFISTCKAKAGQNTNSLHSKFSCINWNVLICISLVTPDNCFASHTVIQDSRDFIGHICIQVRVMKCDDVMIYFCWATWELVPLRVHMGIDIMKK